MSEAKTVSFAKARPVLRRMGKRSSILARETLPQLLGAPDFLTPQDLAEIFLVNATAFVSVEASLEQRSGVPELADLSRVSCGPHPRRHSCMDQPKQHHPT